MLLGTWSEEPEFLFFLIDAWTDRGGCLLNTFVGLRVGILSVADVVWLVQEPLL